MIIKRKSSDKVNIILPNWFQSLEPKYQKILIPPYLACLRDRTLRLVLLYCNLIRLFLQIVSQVFRLSVEDIQ